MPVLNLDLDYNVVQPKDLMKCPQCQFEMGRQQVPPNRELTAEYIRMSIRMAYPHGIEGQKRRIWGRIDRALDVAEEKKESSIEIEQAGIDFIRKAVKECKVDSRLVKYYMIFEDALENLGK